MDIVRILCEPAVIIILSVFLVLLIYTVVKYCYISNNLQRLSQKFGEYKKQELLYRFKELDEYFLNDKFTSSIWTEFKKIVIFPEKIYINSDSDTRVENISDINNSIYITCDSSYFFNEESLITSKINYRLIQIFPTILTGLGPFFTFLKLTYAFSSLDFADTENMASSMNNLIFNIQLAAICSVLAVGCSLFFMALEKIMYNTLCRSKVLQIQTQLGSLFDVGTSERFLLDLLKEAKSKSGSETMIANTLPEAMSRVLNKNITEGVLPYLENIVYSLNKLQEAVAGKNKGNTDIIDKLF